MLNKELRNELSAKKTLHERIIKGDNKKYIKPQSAQFCRNNITAFE